MSSPVRVLERVEEHPAPSKSRTAARILSRILRIAIAVMLLVLSAWVLLPFGVVPVSIVAVTNARVSRVRSSVNGQLESFAVEVGDRVTVGQTLAHLATVAPGALAAAEQLLKQKSDVEIQDAGLNAQIADTEAHLQDYTKDVNDYIARMIAETDMRLQQAIRDLDAAKSWQREAKQAAKAPPSEEMVTLDQEITRMTIQLRDLRAKYSDSHPDVQRLSATLADARNRRQQLVTAAHSAPSEAGTDQLAAARDVESRTATVERLRREVVNLNSGYFVGPDLQAPPTVALRDEATATLARLREQKLVLDLQQKSISEQMGKQMSTTGGESVAVGSSVDGIVWSRDMPTGQTVRQGDDLIRIAETKSLQVEAWVDGRYARKLSIGDRAIVSLSSNRRLEGRILSIQGPGERKADADTYAIELKAPVEGLYHVAVRLDPFDRGTARIGQVAKVLFPGADSSVSYRVYSWVTRIWSDLQI